MPPYAWLVLRPPGIDCPDQPDCRQHREDRADNPRRGPLEDDALGDQPPADQATDPVDAHAQYHQGDEDSHPGVGWLRSIPSFLSHTSSPPPEELAQQPTHAGLTLK